MNIMGLLSNGMVQWGIGIVIGCFLFEYARKLIISVISKSIEKLNKQINQIQNETLRKASLDAVRYIAEKMPEKMGNSEKLRQAIIIVQQLTPDIIISDEKVKIFIESAYNELKNELKKI